MKHLPKMKVLIAGSRDHMIPTWRIEQAFGRLVTELDLFDYPEEIEVVTGGARGIDRCGANWAIWASHKSTVMPADWDKYGKRAGYIRNKQMAESGLDGAIVYWDGESRGTKMMLDLLEANGTYTLTYHLPLANIG